MNFRRKRDFHFSRKSIALSSITFSVRDTAHLDHASNSGSSAVTAGTACETIGNTGVSGSNYREMTLEGYGFHQLTLFLLKISSEKVLLVCAE